MMQSYINKFQHTIPLLILTQHDNHKLLSTNKLAKAHLSILTQNSEHAVHTIDSICHSVPLSWLVDTVTWALLTIVAKSATISNLILNILFIVCS